MSSKKLVLLLIVVQVVVPKLYGEIKVLQEGVNGYAGCNDKAIFTENTYGNKNYFLEDQNMSMPDYPEYPLGAYTC